MDTLKQILKAIKFFILIIFGILIIALLIIYSPGLWRHWITYPQRDKEVAKLNKLRHKPYKVTNLNAYRGVMHVHSYLSNDSKGKQTENMFHGFIPTRFICMNNKIFF